MKRDGRGLPVEHVAGPAAAAGLRPGDVILAIDGRPPIDVLDLELAAADGSFELTVSRGRRRLDLDVVLPRGVHHGVGLRDVLGVPVRRCVNSCLFCFVDQVPPGLRASLRVKDDDYRASFLSGSFVTLTNLSEVDLRRIEALHLSPLYVSLHDWDDDRRVRLMGPRARVARERLLRLAQGGIRMHLQIVLCPGYNDGLALHETVGALAAIESVEDVGVVPVSVPAGHTLRAPDADDAVQVLQTVHDWQARLHALRGRAFVHAADEFYLLVGELPPPSDAPNQYENGVGIVDAFLTDIGEAAAGASSRRPPLALLCGRAAEVVVAGAAQRLGEGARALVVANRLFGPHVTVTGLLGGQEVLDTLRESGLHADEWVLAPASFLPSEVGATLDGVGEDVLRRACHGRLIVAPTLSQAFARLPQ